MRSRLKKDADKQLKGGYIKGGAVMQGKLFKSRE